MTSGEASATDSETSKRTPNLESLTIHDFELAVIDDLSPLLGRSPRALKRFVNVYRLVKAGLTPAEHVVFIQQVDDQLDEYAAVLFLLAVDTGLPRVAAALFDRLDGIDPSTEGELVKFIDSLHDHPAAKTGDYVKLQEWAKGPKRKWWYAKNAVGRLAAWSGRVARHSFQVAHAGKTPPAKQDNPRAHGHASRG
jgi:hypothetical protein